MEINARVREGGEILDSKKERGKRRKIKKKMPKNSFSLFSRGSGYFPVKLFYQHATFISELKIWNMW